MTKKKETADESVVQVEEKKTAKKTAKTKAEPVAVPAEEKPKKSTAKVKKEPVEKAEDKKVKKSSKAKAEEPAEEKPKKSTAKAKAEPVPKAEDKKVKKSSKAKAEEPAEAVVPEVQATAPEEIVEDPVEEVKDIEPEPEMIPAEGPSEKPVEDILADEPEVQEEPQEEIIETPAEADEQAVTESESEEVPVEEPSAEDTQEIPEESKDDSSNVAEAAAAAAVVGATAGVAAGAASAEAAAAGTSMAGAGSAAAGTVAADALADAPEVESSPQEETVEASAESTEPIPEPEADGHTKSKRKGRSGDYTHRNVRYKPGSWFSQMMTVMKLELRMNLKVYGPFALFFGLALMAVLALFAIGDILKFVGMIANTGTLIGLEDLYGGKYVALILFMLSPVFAIHIARMSKAIPQDFDKSLAFIYLTQPVSRSALYIGRFIAAFIPVIVMVLTAFPLANALSLKAGGVGMDVMLISMITCILGGFALGSMIFWMSAKAKKGKPVTTFLLVFAAIPMIYFAVGLLPFIKPDLDSQIMDIVTTVKTYVMYLPAFAPDLSLLQMGGSGYSFSVFGLYSFMDALMFSRNNSAYVATGNIGIIPLYLVYIAWGVLFMILGIRRYKRREM